MTKRKRVTPSPWVIRRLGRATTIVALKDGGFDRSTVCVMLGSESPEELEANAKAISALPQLIRAAKEVCKKWTKGDLAEAVRRLNDSVDFAEGKL